MKQLPTAFVLLMQMLTFNSVALIQRVLAVLCELAVLAFNCCNVILLRLLTRPGLKRRPLHLKGTDLVRKELNN